MIDNAQSGAFSYMDQVQVAVTPGTLPVLEMTLIQQDPNVDVLMLSYVTYNPNATATPALMASQRSSH